MIRALAEAEQEKCEFEKIRNQVEHVLLQLKVDFFFITHLLVSMLIFCHTQDQGIPQDMQVMKKSSNKAPVCSFLNSQFPEPYECHTFPKSRANKVERNSTATGLVCELEDEEEDRYGSGTFPVYAQVRKPLRSPNGKKVVRDVDMQY